MTENLFFSKEMVTKQLIENYYTMAHRGNETARFSFASVESQFLYTDIQKTLKEMKIFFVLYGENKTDVILMNK